MVGFSRLMEDDESGTLDRHSAVLRDIIEPDIAKHGGKVLKYIGDGILATFDSVVAAVKAAAAIQRSIAAETSANPAHPQYRIAVNLGDVILENNDVFGDAVNVTSRLQQMAEPGGVVVAGAAYDHLKSAVDVGYEFLGEHQLKNIETPVRVYRLLLNRRTAFTVSRKRLSRRTGLVAAVAVLAMIAVVAISTLEYGPPEGINTVPRTLDGPSVAVLPFEDLSAAPDEGWFADGVTADLTTDLSKIPEIFVTARNSSFFYKERTEDAGEIGRQLGVRYLLRGSIQRSGDRLRIRAELVDATTGEAVWAERYDDQLEDIFDVQDRVTRSVVRSLSEELLPAVITTPETESDAAYEAFLRGREHLRHDTPEDLAAARDYFEKAIELDPNYGRANAALAQVYYRAFERGWNRPLGVGWNVARLRSGRYMSAAWKNPTADVYRVNSEILLRVARTEDALDSAREALNLDPGDPENQISVARALVYSGRPSEAIDLLNAAMRRDVHFPARYLYLRGLANFGMQEYTVAAADLEESLARNPANHRANAILAASLAYLGDIPQARRQWTHYRDIERLDTVKGRMSDQTIWLRWPYKQSQDWQRLAVGLVRASGKKLEDAAPEQKGDGEFFEYMLADD